MAADSGLMDWSPGGIVKDLSTSHPHPDSLDIAVPGGFPITPTQSPDLILAQFQPATEDSAFSRASKRLCTATARAAQAFGYYTISMASILADMPFRNGRSRQLEGRKPASHVFAGNGSSSLLLSQSSSSVDGEMPEDLQPRRNPGSRVNSQKPSEVARLFLDPPPDSSGGSRLNPEDPPLTKTKTSHFDMRGLDHSLPSTTKFWNPLRNATPTHSQPPGTPQTPPSAELSMPRESRPLPSYISKTTVNSPPEVKILSPFPIIHPTSKRLPLPQDNVPDSSPARQLAAELDTAATDDKSDSSSTFDGNWVPLALRPAPSIPTKIVTRSQTSIALDTSEWHYGGDNWKHDSDVTESPRKQSTANSRAKLLEEGQYTSRRTRQSLLKAKLALGDTSKFDIKPLSPEWEAKVASALKNGHGKLQARDFLKIVPQTSSSGFDAWLNDESINEYLALITKHANRDVKPKSTPRMHAFSTFFYTSLQTGGYAKVARWAKRANLAGSALLNVDMIFIPINPNQSHWTLAVIQPRVRRITHYNSLGSGSKKYLEIISQWLAGELGTSFNEDEWTLDYTADSPQQANTSDCGVFTVTTAKQLMLGLDPMTYGARDIQTQRRRMVAELVNGELLQA